MDYREEISLGGEIVSERFIVGVSNLFHDFPSMGRDIPPIRIETSGSTKPFSIKLTLDWFFEERTDEGFKVLTLKTKDLFEESAGIPGLMLEANGHRRIFAMSSLNRASRYFLEEPLSSKLPCMFVNPYGFRHTGSLGPLWDNLALSEKEADVISALQLIEPDIEAVSMIGGERPGKERTAIVRKSNSRRPVPLRTYGDGVNRLFGIVLSLVNAKGGLLLIDEIENGLHHGVQVDIWRAIFRIAKQLNVQVFATSHSWDSISAFQVAASEDEDEGVLIRLSKVGEEVVATTFREDDLRIATRDHIEVR